jgi:hypothetical protein
MSLSTYYSQLHRYEAMLRPLKGTLTHELPEKTAPRFKAAAGGTKSIVAHTIPLPARAPLLLRASALTRAPESAQVALRDQPPPSSALKKQALKFLSASYSGSCRESLTCTPIPEEDHPALITITTPYLAIRHPIHVDLHSSHRFLLLLHQDPTANQCQCQRHLEVRSNTAE